MDVSIIILNYKTRGLIKQQLKNFFASPVRLGVEVIVVDNNSGDGVCDMLAREFGHRSFPHVRCISLRENRGYAAGNNVGMRASHGKYYLIANPDIVLTSAVVETLYDFMEAHAQVGIAGPQLVYPDGSLQYSCLRYPNWMLPLIRRTSLTNTGWGKKWLANYFMQDWDHASPRDVDWLFGACLMVRGSCLPTVGYLDERFFLYLEDTDWCRRFWESGFEVWYVPTATAIHLLRRSSEGPLLSILVNKTARAHLVSFFAYLRKYWGKPNPHHSA